MVLLTGQLGKLFVFVDEVNQLGSELADIPLFVVFEPDFLGYFTKSAF